MKIEIFHSEGLQHAEAELVFELESQVPCNQAKSYRFGTYDVLHAAHFLKLLQSIKRF
jgi:hypothetical protein